MADGSVRWALADNQGTVRDVVDSEGNVLNHVSYDSFGTEERPSPYEAFGNFNHGVTGRAANFPDIVLKREAGRAQIAADTSPDPSWGEPGYAWDIFGFSGTGTYGDDPRDTYWIQKGIEYYDRYHTNFRDPKYR